MVERGLPAELLAELGLAPEGAGAGDGPSVAGRAALMRAAGRMGRIFRLSAPDAPGLAFIGGTASPSAYGLRADGLPAMNVSGRGLTAASAFAGCVGEAVESLSRLEWGDEPLRRAGPEPLGAHRPATADRLAEAARSAVVDWLPARRLDDDRPCLVPADLCLRRAAPGGHEPGSAGCAAGETWDDACLRALLELIERDAAALWWCGGQPARPLAVETLMRDAGPMLLALRAGEAGRRTWFLDITTDLEVPVVAAVSTDPGGKGFACGLAARASLAEAAAAAVIELCQMELANRLVALKLRRGGALAPVEQRHRRRLEAVDAGRSAVLAAQGNPRPDAAGIEAGTPGRQLGRIVEGLAARGIDCLAVDLTRTAIGIPVARVLAPFLQSLPVKSSTDRLEGARIANRSRLAHLHDADLI